MLQIVVSGSTVYLGGTFQKVNGDKNRDRLASVDATTGVATAWAPTTTGWVSQMRASGPTVYLAGRFSDVNGTSRNNLAAVTADSGTTTAWNPNVETSYPGASPVINSMAVLGSKVYVAGRIAKIGGVERSSVGAVDAQTGAVSPWAPVVDQEGAWALAAAGSQVYLGGQFGAVNGVARNHLASVDATTGALTDFNPNLKDPPYELAADGSNVHVFGNFDAPMVLGGTISRNFLVRLNPLTAAVADWEPGSTRRIAAIATAGADAFAAAGTEYSFGNDSFAVFGSAPRLTTQPAGQTVNDGVDAAFTAAVSGFPTPALQWQTSTDGATFSDLAGQTGTTLTLPAASAAQSGTRYRLRATSLAGTVVSDAAALTVLADEKPPQEQPPIAEQPPPMTLQPATNARPGRAHLVSRTATIRDGIARVTLGCTGATPCTGKLTLRIPGRRGTLISGRYAIRTEKQATLKLRVSGRAQRLLFKSRARRQTTVVLAATSGPPVRATLTLRRSRG